MIGFTGTQRGMTLKQMIALKQVLPEVANPDGWAGHGDCIGADANAHLIFRERGLSIRGYLPSNPRLRAYCKFDEVRDPQPYLVRNRSIVTDCHVLLACPAVRGEVLRSGTWATIRYARLRGRPIIIIWPDGTTTKEREI